jgi:DNA-binding CsgD family transcriptional regulator
MTPGAVAAEAPRVEERAGPSGTGAAAVLRICDAGPGAPTALPDHVSRVRRALVALREPMSVEHLEDSVPAAVAMLGFDRVVYARLCGADWRAAGVRAGTQALDVPAAGPVRIDATFEEYPVLVEQVPVIVGPGSAHRLLPVQWCRSYLAAPVLERGTVVGLIHAGYHDPVRRLSALDREVLWIFAEALAPSLASAHAGDALRDLLVRAARFAGELGQVGPGPTGAHPVGAPPDLSGRECEVLELMAAGQTNGQIARRLVITEGTVKSHVKRIMRKLRAANRAEAVAAWMRPAERVHSSTPFARARTAGASAS